VWFYYWSNVYAACSLESCISGDGWTLPVIGIHAGLLHPAVWKTCTYSEIRKKKMFPYRRKTRYIPSGNPAQDIHGKSLCLIGKSGKSSTNGGFSIAMSAMLVAAQPEQHLAFPDSADWISRVWKRFPCLRLGNLLRGQPTQPTNSDNLNKLWNHNNKNIITILIIITIIIIKIL
jgi:hypothetical protein